MLYKVLLFLHMAGFVSWLAGLLYLPRLFVYHVGANKESALMLETMELRLLKIIMTPAMVATWLAGLGLASLETTNHAGVWTEGWFLAKLLCLVILSAFHVFLARCRKDFVKGANRFSARFFRRANEVPTLLFITILFLAIFKPF